MPNILDFLRQVYQPGSMTGGWPIQNQPTSNALPSQGGQMRPSSLPTSGGMPEYIKSLQTELDAMLPPEPPQGKWAKILERGLTGAALVGEGADTVGGNIAGIANALLGINPAIQQRHMQQRMAPLQQLQPLMQLHQQRIAEQQAQAGLEKTRAEISGMPADIEYKQAGAAALRHQAGAPYPIPSRPTPYTTSGLDPYSMGESYIQPVFNQETGELEYKQAPAGAMPVPKASAGSDYSRYEDNYIATLNEDRANRGQPPLNPIQERAARAEAYQRISGIKSGITQDITGGLPQTSREAMEIELKPLESQLLELQKADPLEYRLAQAMKMGKMPSAKDAETLRKKEMTAIQKSIDAIQKRYTGTGVTNAPASSNVDYNKIFELLAQPDK